MPRAPSYSVLLLLGAVLVHGGCGENDPAASPSPDGGEPSPTGTLDTGPITSPGPASLSPEKHLLRVSMALTGKRPSLQELRAVRDDPDALGDIVDGYLETDDFGTVVALLQLRQNHGG
mgnify:FL=1